MKIVWDARKRLANIARHGFDFADLTKAFFVDSAIVAGQHGRYMVVGLSMARSPWSFSPGKAFR